MINVFLASDNNFIPFVSTTIISIMENTNSDIKFYILHNNVCKEYQSRLLQLETKYKNCTIEFLKVSENNFANFPVMDYVNETMYFRYLISEIKPEIKKCIYTDADVIFNGDIQTLYNEDLGDFPVGAVTDFLENENPKIKDTHYKNLEISPVHDYFWSGLLLLNCQKLREVQATQKLIAATKEFSAKLVWPDADVYNKVFSPNNYKKLHPKYVFIPEFENRMLQMGGVHEQAAKAPFICHYAGFKPWQDLTLNKAEKFWEIAEKSQFYVEIKSTYKRNWTYKEIKLGKFKLLKMQRTKQYSKIKLFGKITLFKIFTKKNCRHYQLLGFMPIFKIRLGD